MPSYGLMDGGRVLVLSKMNPGESGSYKCRVRDSFDNSSAWFESPAVQVRMIEATLMPIEIISISFCCVLFLILAVGFVYVMRRMGDRRRAQILFPCPPSLLWYHRESRGMQLASMMMSTIGLWRSQYNEMQLDQEPPYWRPCLMRDFTQKQTTLSCSQSFNCIYVCC
ncbi:hypothetical protein CRUP_003003 [Coryphaenoides rupestris]|nr:hypothetical protein CRUP_003003 [Coryphaenoides rupestris]